MAFAMKGQGGGGGGVSRAINVFKKKLLKTI